MFSRFIEQRSFVTAQDSLLAFFDNCLERVSVWDLCIFKFSWHDIVAAAAEKLDCTLRVRIEHIMFITQHICFPPFSVLWFLSCILSEDDYLTWSIHSSQPIRNTLGKPCCVINIMCPTSISSIHSSHNHINTVSYKVMSLSNVRVQSVDNSDLT